MDRNEKIARALGFLDGGEYHYWIPVELIPKRRISYIESVDGWQAEFTYDEDHGEGWFVERGVFDRLVADGDPYLEKAVRDKVRELCETVCYNHTCGEHEVTVFKRNIRNHLIPFKSGDKDTEPEAYAAALIWLDERGRE